MRISRAYILVALAVLATCGAVDARPKTDVVVLKNGDRVTCEIKNLTRGKLETKTDSMGKVYIEWSEIVALNSKYYFHVTASNGAFYYGSLEIGEGTGVLRVVSDTTIVNLPMLSAVSIAPIEKTFWSRNRGSAEIGFNYAKSTDLAELYFDVSNRYRTRRNILDSQVYTNITNQGGSEGTKRRAGLGGAYYYVWRRSLTPSAGAKLERNDELNVKMRFVGRLALGYTQIATNENTLLLAGGLAFNSEKSYSDNETTSSLEAVLYANFKLFKYNDPETSIEVSTSLYPSITESGRYRFELALDVRREIVNNLFFDLEFYDDYDNKPPSGEGPTSDYGIKTSLGYTWN